MARPSNNPSTVRKMSCRIEAANDAEKLMTQSPDDRAELEAAARSEITDAVIQHNRDALSKLIDAEDDSDATTAARKHDGCSVQEHGARKEAELMTDPNVKLEEYDTKSILDEALLHKSNAKFERLKDDVSGFRLTTDGTRHTQFCFGVPVDSDVSKVTIKMDHLVMHLGGVAISIVGAGIRDQLAIISGEEDINTALVLQSTSQIIGDASVGFVSGQNERNISISVSEQALIQQLHYEWIGLQVRPLVSGIHSVVDSGHFQLALHCGASPPCRAVSKPRAFLRGLRVKP